MVCTKAFGVGINQPDVETVVRVGCPQSLEDFVQKFGRAGRDGRPAGGKKFIKNHYNYLVVHSTTNVPGILLYCEKDLSFRAKKKKRFCSPFFKSHGSRQWNPSSHTD